MRSTGQVGPACTVPWIPVPGCAAGVPQAAIVSARANDTMRDVIEDLEDYDAGPAKKYRRPGGCSRPSLTGMARAPDFPDGLDRLNVARPPSDRRSSRAAGDPRLLDLLLNQPLAHLSAVAEDRAEVRRQG